MHIYYILQQDKEQEDDEVWDVQTDGEQQQESEQKPQPVWITDSKNNIKYAITHLNYSQVYNTLHPKLFCTHLVFEIKSTKC